MSKMLLGIVLLVCSIPSFAGKIKGRVTASLSGEPVAYANIGVRNSSCGTLSDKDGRFILYVPDSLSGRPISFSHISFLPQDLSPAPVMEVVLEPATYTIEEVLVRPGKPHEKQLVGGCVSFPGVSAAFGIPDKTYDSLSDRTTVVGSGQEIGSVITIKYPTKVKNIGFTVIRNSCEYGIVRLNVYRIENDSTLVNLLHKPIYVTIPNLKTYRDFVVEPQEDLWLDQGRYYFSVEFVEVKYKGAKENMILFPICMKRSYYRANSMARLEPEMISIGMSVAGIEYR